jgi:hypothetical protein
MRFSKKPTISAWIAAKEQGQSAPERRRSKAMSILVSDTAPALRR